MKLKKGNKGWVTRLLKSSASQASIVRVASDTPVPKARMETPRACLLIYVVDSVPEGISVLQIQCILYLVHLEHTQLVERKNARLVRSLQTCLSKS